MRRLQEFHTKYFKKNNTIWLYWENLPGAEMPDYIKLCHAAIKYWVKGVNLQIVTPENLSFFLPSLHENIHDIRLSSTKEISLAIKTDFIRVFLLEKYGGLYIDSDSLPLEPLKNILVDVKRYGFVAVRRTSNNRNHISIGLLGATRENIIIKQYAKKLRDILKNQTYFKWAEIGAHLLTPIVNENPLHAKILPERVAHPIPCEEQWKFMSPHLSLSDICSSDTLIAMLFHKPFSGPSPAIHELNIPACKRGWLSGWDMDALYNSNTLLSKLYQRSLPQHKYRQLLRD